jgi:hypothetical protein
MHVNKRNWNLYNLQLVNRGRPSTYIKSAFADNGAEVSRLNKDKVGHPYVYLNILILSVFALKCVFKVPYRAAEGIIKDYTERNNISEYPNFRTIQWRVSQMKKDGIKFMIYDKGKDLDVLIDSTGIKSSNDGEYRSTRYGKRKVWTKIHVAVDRKTHRILNIIVTDDHIGDVREFEPLIEPIKEANTIGNAAADGAYDSEENFKYCDDNNINAFIPVRINSIGKRGKHRRKHVIEQLGIIRKRGRNCNIMPPKEIRRANQINWKNSSGYHMRSLVESTFSVFKNVFGEYTFSKNKDMKEKELFLKVVAYNRFLI